jgi:hypothetical protein
MFSGKESDFKRGMELMKRGCSLGSKLSCGVNRPPGQRKIRKPGEKPIGVLQTVEDSQGRGTTGDARQVMKDLVKLDKLLHQNCKLGYADACAELGEPADPDDPVLRKQLGPAELAAKIRKLERQAAAGPAAKK